jgi:hypothetical protein
MRPPEVNYGIESAPFDEDIALQVTDGRGGPYTLHWPCRLTASGWIDQLEEGNAVRGHASEVEAIPRPAASPSSPQMTSRRFPAPWRADPTPGGHVVRDANGQALAYSRDTPT